MRSASGNRRWYSRPRYTRKTAKISSPGQQSVPGIRNRCTILKLGPRAESSFRSANRKSISSISHLRLSFIHQPNPPSFCIQPFLRSAVNAREHNDTRRILVLPGYFLYVIDIGFPLARAVARHDEDVKVAMAEAMESAADVGASR